MPRREFDQTSQDIEYPAPTEIHITSGAGAIVVIGSFLFSVIILFATARNEEVAAVGMVVAVLFFGVFTPIGLMAANGSIAHIITNGQNQHTARGVRQPQRLTLVDPLRIEGTPPTHPLALDGPSYVPARAEPDDSAKREAAAWLLQLYQADGTPDPKKVLLQSNKERPGRIRISAPSTPAKQWLLERRIIRDMGTGYKLNLAKVPTITAAQKQLL